MSLKKLGVVIKIWLHKILCEENTIAKFKTYKSKLCYHSADSVHTSKALG